MNKIRAFVAAPLSLEVANQLLQLQSELRQRAQQQGLKVAWVPPTNLHVTLKFLAQIPQESIWAVRDSLRDQLQKRPALPVVACGAGAFPSVERPRVLWAGVQSESDALSQLAGDVDGWLAELGFAKETRPFHPHVTLGRVKQGAGNILEGLEEQALGECLVQEVVLYQSVLDPRGARYTPLVRVPLVPGRTEE